MAAQDAGWGLAPNTQPYTAPLQFEATNKLVVKSVKRGGTSRRSDRVTQRGARRHLGCAQRLEAAQGRFAAAEESLYGQGLQAGLRGEGVLREPLPSGAERRGLVVSRRSHSRPDRGPTKYFASTTEQIFGQGLAPSFW